MDMMEIQPQRAEVPPNETEMNEQDQKEIFYDQQPTQKQAQKKPQPSIPPIVAKQERPQPTLQQLRRRKQMRRRQMEERQANQFLKQPVIKIPNLKKNLKRAYEKNFFDDSKYEYIHTLRKLRKHPERDSVSSHYGSDESFDIKEHFPKRGFHKRKFTQDDESSESDSEKQTRKKRVSKPRQRKPKVKKENVDSTGEPKPAKPRKPRTVSKQAKPMIKVTNTTKPKPEATNTNKDEAKGGKTAKAKQLNKDESSSQEDLQSDSNSQLSSEKVKAQKISKDPPKAVAIPPKIDNQQKKEFPAKQILEKPAPITQQIPLKKIVAPNTIIAPAPKSSLLPSGIAKRPELAQKISTKPLKNESDSQTSSSQSSSSSSYSSSSDSDSSSDNRHKKKKKHTKSKKHRDSSSDSSDHSKRKKKHKKRKYVESSTFKEGKKHRQAKQELKGKIEPQKSLAIQNKAPQTKFQSQAKQHSNLVSALFYKSSIVEQAITRQAQRREAEILNKNIQLPILSQNVTQPAQKAFKLQSQSLALALSHKDAPVSLKTQSEKQNENVSTSNIIQLNPSLSNNIMAPINKPSQVIVTSSSKNNETSPNPPTKYDKEFSKEAELKFDPKVVVLSLVGSSPSSNHVQNTKEKHDMKQRGVRKPPPPLTPVKPKTIKIQEFSDEDSQQSYISYRKRARYPREKIVRLRKVIVQSESDFNSSSQQGYVERRVIKRVRRPQRVVLDSSSQSQNRLDYSKKVRVMAKNKNVDQKMSKVER